MKVDWDKAIQQIKDLENNRDAVKIDWVDKISWLALKRKKVFNSISCKFWVEGNSAVFTYRV